MIYLMRNISYEILDKTQLTTDILLKFEDIGINKDYYTFIKDKLDNFKLEINHNYSITVIDSKYDESKKLLLIEFILTIPDHHKPTDVDLEQIINDKSYKFSNFYERNIQLYKTKNENGGQ